jgi:NifU-like protein
MRVVRAARETDMWDYTEKVKEHFLNPKNVGEIEDADGVGEVGSIACGDALKLFLKIEDGKIVDASFQTFGCGSAIASASALTEMVKGKTLDEAAAISNDDIAETLGGLPRAKMHCSVMGREALEAAIANYRGEEIHAHDEDEGRLVCTCFGITEDKIRRAVREDRLESIEDITNFTKAGGGCQTCHPDLEEIIEEEMGKIADEPPAAPLEAEPKRLTNIQKMMMVQETIDREIRPALRQDGGDIELIDIEGNRVIVALRGQCVECPASNITLKHAVESKLREFVAPELEVEEVR